MNEVIITEYIFLYVVNNSRYNILIRRVLPYFASLQKKNVHLKIFPRQKKEGLILGGGPLEDEKRLAVNTSEISIRNIYQHVRCIKKASSIIIMFF